MLTVQLIMQSGKPLVMKLPISATVHELKTELQSLLDIQVETLEICASDVTWSDSDLLTEVAGLGKTKQIKPVVSCYEGNNFVGLILFSLQAEDIAVPLVDNSVSDPSIDVVSLEGSESSGSELSSGSSGKSIQPSPIDCKRGIKRKAQEHEKTIETKRFKKVLESSEESVENPSYGDMQEACGMGGCGIKSRPRPVKSEIEMEPDVMNGQRPPYVNILPENRPFVVVISSSECEKNFCDLLEEFFGIFLDFRNVRCLDFNEVTPVIEYNGRLYIAAANEDTMDWVGRNVCAMESYQATSLIDFLHLTPARVTWPKVEKCLQSIFELLELQNADITTDKWAVVSREDAPPIVTNICPNEQVEIWIDAESVNIIKGRCNQLKLSFWIIKFEFCD
ncbi:uncharacterized protein Dwil_GK27914 [Drosophila willistoni]|uniref:DUF4780 domain-containing protein n=1 Tax=Drosophila willistoni TaxID=7260 RepID=A0A0Q9X5U7_DROWI|nr:uncharacterized protein LOC111519519 isoform X2 [Drosophila willistoni]KRG00103.1 uncharacterized protein Dwil_GK27914 [Drosophila willistoni]